MKKISMLYFVLILLLFLIACEDKDASVGEKSGKTTEKPKAEKTLFAVFETSMGNIEAKLYRDKAPKTVKNFVELAQGKKEWADPKTLQRATRPLYSGTVFHRVIPNFMIQGGDPKGNGTGGPGYVFEDEIDPGLVFDRAGILAMANAGPDTNGSQFFITEAPTPHLNGKHTIFGEVVRGMEVVKAIARTPRDGRDKPLEDVVLKRIRIVER